MLFVGFFFILVRKNWFDLFLFFFFEDFLCKNGFNLDYFKM